MEKNKAYWENRVEEQGYRAVSTVGDFGPRTAEEIEFLIGEISRVYPNPVNLSIDFGSGWGRLFPVLMRTSKKQILVDFVEENKKLWEMAFPNPNGAAFSVCAIKDFVPKTLADYALTSFSLLHIIDGTEYQDSVKKIVESVRENGHLFIFESYTEAGVPAPHCSDRKREEFIEPFKDCSLEREMLWQSRYQPFEMKECHQPMRLFTFGR